MTDYNITIEDLTPDPVPEYKNVPGVVTRAELGDKFDSGKVPVRISLEVPIDSPDKTTVESAIFIDLDRIVSRDFSGLTPGQVQNHNINKALLMSFMQAAGVKNLTDFGEAAGRTVIFSAKAGKQDPSKYDFKGFKTYNGNGHQG